MPENPTARLQTADGENILCCTEVAENRTKQVDEPVKGLAFRG